MNVYKLIVWLFAISGQHPIAHQLVVETSFVTINLAYINKDYRTFNEIYYLLRHSNQRTRLFQLVLNNLTDSNDTWRHILICCLVDFPDLQKQATPVLRKIADDGTIDTYDRVSAVSALGRIALPDRDTTTTLTRCLSASSGSLRGATCVALWRIEGKSDRFLTTLNALLGDTEWRDNIAGLRAAQEIGPAIKDKVGPGIIKLASSGHPYAQMAAYPLLPVFAPTKEIAAIELVKGLVSVTNEATKLREAFEAKKITLEAYASAGRASQQDLRLVTHHIISLGEAALPELFKLTTTKDDADIRYNALNALRGMNFPRKSAPAERVLAEVRRLLDDTNPSVKALAEVTLKKLMAE